jgi:hypothetical protein
MNDTMVGWNLWLKVMYKIAHVCYINMCYSSFLQSSDLGLLISD